MMVTASNPRSALHALQPFGQGTAEVESLLSYFCRLAVSHSTSTLILSRTVANLVKHEISADYDWHERQISGIGESAVTWSAALAALTTVGGLDSLTFPSMAQYHRQEWSFYGAAWAVLSCLLRRRPGCGASAVFLTGMGVGGSHGLPPAPYGVVTMLFELRQG